MRIIRNTGHNPEMFLDDVLQYLNNDVGKRESFTEILKNGRFHCTEKDLQLALDKLLLDKLIECRDFKLEGIPTGKQGYNILFDGRLFLKRSGYRWRRFENISNKAWKIFKTFIIAANAGVLLYIAWDANQNQKEVDFQEKKINSLKTEKNQLSEKLKELTLEVRQLKERLPADTTKH